LPALLLGALCSGFIFIRLGVPAAILYVSFFVLGTACTYFHYDRKSAASLLDEPGGQRGIASIVARSVAPVAFSIMKSPVPFVAAMAQMTFDSVASETGKGIGCATFDVIQLKRVAPESPGGVFVAGTVGGLAGAATITGMAVALGVIGARSIPGCIGIATGVSLLESVVWSALPAAWVASHCKTVKHILNGTMGLAAGLIATIGAG
ncbi:MAG: DUF92 domain-containing protein, partial [Burkholderiales bacterium]